MEENEAERAPAELLLIQRVLAGEKDLFHELIRPYERGAFLLAYSILRNQEDAEEIVQQAMIKIFSHLAELTERYKFKRWAMRVVENEAKMYRRKRRLHLYESIDQNSADTSEEDRFYPKQFADWRDLPNEAVEQQEVREAVAKALGELPDIYREVFVLRDMQHLNVAETRRSWASARPPSRLDCIGRASCCARFLLRFSRSRKFPSGSAGKGQIHGSLQNDNRQPLRIPGRRRYARNAHQN